MTDMNLDHLPEVTSTRLGRYDRTLGLVSAAWHALLRAVGRDRRYYLTMDGHVLARFNSEFDHLAFMTWLHETHTATFYFGYNMGRGSDAENLAELDAGEPGPA